ncbi:helix-turn-helix transcriptional regulator [Kitasatospora sp. NPDC048538]|uniref:helix-turn-helix domain-containing protein n=1 Tax=unclassified Kitasatospora TaxID=2633591 RepID=UPI0033E848C2
MRETNGPAQLLQELKSRSGLSYGVLAKKLHLSTSTLHRYCNGDVTPTEFAPLDQLARLCKATPAELVELYRLWVVADAMRGNRAPSAAPVPAAVDADEGPAAREADAGATTGVVTAAEPAEAAAGRGGVGEVEPASGTEPVDAPAVVGADPGRGPVVPRRWHVRHRGVLAAVTATAVLATVGAVAAGLKAHTDAATPPARAEGVTPSAGPSTPGVHDVPSAPGSPPPAVGADVLPSGPAGGTDPAPITVSVAPAGWDSACDQYVVNRPPSEVPRPPAVQDVKGWAAGVGAVPGHYQAINLTVQGTGKDTVVLTALNVRIVRSAAPLAWNAYSMGEGCGGGVEVHSYDLDLDAARPRPVVTEGSKGLPVKVSEGDPEVIEVTAETTAHDVTWYLELEWTSGNRKGTFPVDLGHGTPFHTSAIKGRPQYVYPIGGKAWEPSPYRR